MDDFDSNQREIFQVDGLVDVADAALPEQCLDLIVGYLLADQEKSFRSQWRVAGGAVCWLPAAHTWLRLFYKQ
ncbi:MAG: hypothetical protein R6X34_26940 [Chloroflexota bacterium]